MNAKNFAKTILRSCGYCLARIPQSRFNALSDTLLTLKSFGYAPKVIIDAGANIGEWSKTVHEIFPDSKYHLIEPQPGCQSALRSLSKKINATVHETVLTEPGKGDVYMIGDGDGNTGAWVCGPNDYEKVIKVPATTLDEIVNISPSDRALLKLDLEGHEFIALRGASKCLQAAEVIITETSFYWHEGEPSFLNMANQMNEYDFQLFDFASLSSPISHRRLRSGDIVFVSRSSPLLRCFAI